MSESIEIAESVRVFVRSLDEAPEHVDLEVADHDDPGEFYYEVSLTDLGEKVGKRYIRYDGPEGRGFYDTKRGILKTRPRVKDEETNENTVKNEIFSKADRILDKYKIYVSEAETYAEARQMAPDWADVQETEQGAFYYEKLPGQGEGGDDEERETGDYDVDSTFGEIVADRVLNDDVGDIPVDDFHEHMSEVDDPELVKDALRAEKDGPDRKTGKQFIEVRARELGIDLDALEKESGPDVTGELSRESLAGMEVKPEELSDEIIVSADEHDHTTQDWSVRKLYEEYVETDNVVTGMGNPSDIPAGSLKRVLDEEVDDPAVLMQFWENGSHQTKRDVTEILEEMGYNPYAETVSGENRFDLDGMDRLFDADEALDKLEEGDFVYTRDYGGGMLAGVIDEVEDDVFMVKDPSGRTATSVGHGDIIRDEYALAEILETDGMDENSHLHHWSPEDTGFIERIEDDSVLSRALAWDDEDNEMMLHEDARGPIRSRLNEIDPVDAQDYGIDDDTFKTLHGATWPEWDESGWRKMGSGVSDDLRSVYEQTSTEDLKKYAEACEDMEMDERVDVVNGMLFYRDDADVEIYDLFDYNQAAHGNYLGVTDDAEDKIMGAAEDTMHRVEPHVGAQLAGHIEKFELQKPPDDSSWAGQSQSGGRKMAIDDPHNTERVTSHEMGHALHNFMGIKNDGYGRIDNRDHSNNPDQWEFGAKNPNNGNDNSEEFYEDMRESWEEYVETQKGNSDEGKEIRPYQKRHGVELMAVGFAHWVQDPYKIRNRHSGLAEKFDKHVGEGAEERIDKSDIEEGQFIDIALDRGDTATVKVNSVTETAHGYDFDFDVMEGSRRATGVIPDNEFVVEGVSDEYQPLDIEHGQVFEVEVGDEQIEAVIDMESRAPGGDFMLRDKYGSQRGQWTKSQFRDNLVEQESQGEMDIPWTPDHAEKGDIVEMWGVEVEVAQVDDFNNELTLEDTQGETEKLEFHEVYDLKEMGEFEAKDATVDWDEMTTNENYSFVQDDATYNGQVVSISEDEVTIDQGRAGTSTIDRDKVEEVRRKV